MKQRAHLGEHSMVAQPTANHVLPVATGTSYLRTYEASSHGLAAQVRALGVALASFVVMTGLMQMLGVWFWGLPWFVAAALLGVGLYNGVLRLLVEGGASAAQIPQLVHKDVSLQEFRALLSRWPAEAAQLLLVEEPALQALARLDIERATHLMLSIVSLRPGQAKTRRPSLDAGANGELLRSIVAWLGPQRFDSILLANSAQFHASDPDFDKRTDSPNFRRFCELRRWLVLLEARAMRHHDQVRVQWHALMAGQLAREYPDLAILFTAAAATLLEDVRELLEQELEARSDQEAVRRQLVRLWPELQRRERSPFRQVPMVTRCPNDVTSASLELASRIAADPRDMIAWKQSLRWAVLLLICAAVWMGAAFIIASVAALVIVATAYGAKTKALRQRERALLQARPSLDRAWAAEILSNVWEDPDTKRLSAGVQESDLPLVLSCIDAEAAIVRGDLQTAWQCVSWWFDEATVQSRLLAGSRLCIAASIIRIASLCGYASLAKDIVVVGESHFASVGAQGNRGRSCYGGAPSAIRMARVLQYIKLGELEEARALLACAKFTFGYLSSHPRERALVGALGRFLQSAVAVPGQLALAAGMAAIDDKESKEWIDAILPELQRHDCKPATTFPRS